MMQMATSGLNDRDTADASALTNMFRNLGGSIGIALLSTLTQSRMQVHFAAITARVTANAGEANQRLDTLTQAMAGPSADYVLGRGRALAELYGQIRQEALVMAYSDAFTILGIMLVVSMGTLFLLPKDAPTGGLMSL
jgi:DHA2 family multidrug resistance protein